MLAPVLDRIEAAQPVRLREGVLHGQHAAPRVAEDVEGLKPERLANGIHFIYVQADGVDGEVLGYIRIAAAKLIVEDHAAPAFGQSLQRLQVEVTAARPAVQAQKRRLARLLAVADDTVPGAVTMKCYAAFLDLHFASTDQHDAVASFVLPNALQGCVDLRHGHDFNGGPDSVRLRKHQVEGGFSVCHDVRCKHQERARA